MAGLIQNMQDFDIIQPSLIQQMRSILDQYPDDGQIIKELIQNAEDAKAKTIKFLFDKSTYPANTEHLVHPELVHFQGPALYAFNDATFNEQDWIGIRTIYDSFKKDDPIKVGRFGLGFKSVFHMTDMPGILSGDKIGFLDPHEKYFRDGKDRAMRGACWNLADIGGDQSGFYTPFTDPNLGFIFNQTRLTENYYPGTLFRFPLRTTSNNSELCPDEYPIDKVKVLLEQFEQYSYMCLLFLSSLESIELYIRESRDIKPKIFFKVELAEKTKTAIRSKRQSFLAKINTENWLNTPEYLSQEMTIHSQNSKEETHRWLVTNVFAGGDRLPRLKQLFEEKTLHYLPWVAVAMSLDRNFQPLHPEGHVFCFLPLPVEQRSQTGLPIHVNGFFAIDQNRRHLKWPNAEQLSSELTDRSLLWNQALLEEAVPLGYTELIREGINLQIPQNLIHQAIPYLGAVDSKWLQMVDVFLDYVTKIPFLFTKQRGGQHVTLDQALFSFLSETEHADVINAILLKAGRPVVCVPEHVKFALERFDKQVVTPEHLRRAVLDIQNTVEPFPETETHCVEILAYAVADENYSSVVDLKLLPLASGIFTVFQDQCNGHHKVYLTTSDHSPKLFPGLENRLISQSVNSDGQQLLERIAKSDKTNLTMMTKEHVVKMLSLVAPSPVTGDMYPWNPDNEMRLTLCWSETVWNYLVRTFPTDLWRIEDMCLLPLRICDGSMYLKRLSKNSPIIYKDAEISTALDPVFTMAENLGVVVVDGLFPFVKRHPLIHEYVNPPSISGFLSALSVLDRTSVVTKMKAAPHDLVFKFRSELAKADAYTLGEHRELLRSLPMFNVTANTLNCCENALHSLEDIQIMSPNEAIPFRLPKPLIQPEDERTRHFCLLLKGKELTLKDLLVDIIKRHISMYSNTEVEDILTHVIRNRMHLVNNELKLKTCIKECNIFLRSDGELVKLTSLFDPKDHQLQRLFYGQPVFLDGACASYDILPHLRKLGLRTLKDVLPQEILQASQVIVDLPYQKGVEKANEILQLLSVRPDYLQAQINYAGNLKQCIENTAWIPVKMRPREYPTSLEWYGQDEKFQKPSLLYDVWSDNLVGTVRELASVKMIAGMSNARLSMEDVIANLFNVVDAIEKSRAVEESSSFFRVTKDIYKYLQTRLKILPTSKFQDIFKDKKCVLIAERNKFVTPSEVSFSEGFPPFLFKAPTDMIRDFRQLLEAMGVAKKFSVQQYCTLLSDMKTLYGDNPLTSEMLCLARDIAKVIADSTKEEPLAYKVYLPNEANKVLQLASTMCFNDCPWIVDNEMPFVYNEITFRVAHALGVQTKRSKALEDASFGIPFGQKEKLTRRIKRILDGYPGQVDILKELLQNADDAQATEVHFCLDSRNHPTDRIFEDSWKTLQGPALCVYNNKPFTKEDVKGIQNLGEGNKGTDPTKTGQYGVGFNAVYHLTDAPSFLTNLTGEGERLYVFDPHCSYVPAATPEAPGRCFGDLDKLRNTFPSVFECFDSVRRRTALSVNGTLFRFPLRTSEMADKSEIKKCSTSVPDARKMLQNLKKEAQTCLLFMNNVRKISLYEIKDEESAIKPFTVTATVDRSSEVEELNKFKAYTKSALGTDIWSIPSLEVPYEISVSDSDGLNKRWLVVQKFGFEKCELKSERICNAISRNELTLLPRAGVAYELTSSTRQTYMHRHSVFCFLPLPQKTHLPVHVNGHFALDHEARRSVWKSTDGDIKTEWNDLLVRHVIAHAYVRLVEEFKNRVVCLTENTSTRSSLRTYLSLFPKTENTCDFANSIVRSFYCILDNKDVKALPVVHSPSDVQDRCSVTWLPARDEGVNGAIFDNLRTSSIVLPETDTDRNRYQNLATVVLRCGLNLLWEPFSLLVNEFTQSKVAVRTSTPETVMEFFRKPSISNETMLTTDEVIEILKHSKKNKKVFEERLEGTRLLMTEAESIKTFSIHSPMYLSRYTSLATPNYHDMFVHQQLVSEVFSPLSDYLHIPVFKDLSVQALSNMLPKEFESRNEIQLDEIRWEWITEFWSFIGTKTNTLKDVEMVSLDPLSKFCLVPAYRSKNERCLVQIEKCKSVVNNSDKLMERPVLRCLNVLGVPFLYDGNLRHRRALHLIVSSLDNPLDVLLAIELRQESFSIDGVLDKRQSYTLLSYLCSVADKSSSILRRIKHLPFFCTKGESLVKLEDKRGVVLTYNVPSTDAHVWESDSSVVFLDRMIEGTEVMKCLGIEMIRRSDLYANYILQHLGEMSENGRLQHLTFVKDVIMPDLRDCKMRTSFLSRLRNVPFIKRENGMLCTAREFFDWKLDIFSEMLEERNFPPLPFKSSEWHSFLLDIGLQQAVSDDQMITFAQNISRLDSELEFEDKFRKSQLLTSHLLENHEEHARILNKLKNIDFVAQERLSSEIIQLHACFSEERFAKFNGAVLGYGNVHLCWSSAVILTDFSNINESLAGSLGVYLQPPSSLVVRHCSNLCSSIQKHKPAEHHEAWDTDLILSVMTSIYSFFRHNGLSYSETEELRRTPLVIISDHNLFVFARQVVEDITERQQIQPYLFKLPSNIAQFRDLFIRLGASRDLSVNLLGGVLYEIMRYAGGDTLHCEEYKKAKKALLALLSCSDEDISNAVFPNGLFLPTRDNRMVAAVKCVVIDDERVYEDLGDAISFPPLAITASFENDYKDKISHLSGQYRPLILSDLVHTEVETEGNIVKHDQSHNNFVKAIHERLTSDVFHRAFARLVCHASPEENLCVKGILKFVQEKFGKIEVFEAETIKEFYVDTLGSKLCESKLSKNVAVVRGDGSLFKVYINSNVRHVDVYNVLAADMVHHLGVDFGVYVIQLLELLKLDNSPQDLYGILDRYKIQRLPVEEAGVVPGDKIPDDMNHLLEQGFFRFDEGDLVGYDTCRLNDNGEPEFIIAMILKDCTENLDAVIRRYLVSIGDVEVEVNAVDLYNFWRPVPQNEDLHGNSLNKDEAIQDIEKQVQEAWKMTDDQRERFMDRLFMHWHPDRNEDNREACEEIFQRLETIVTMYEQTHQDTASVAVCRRQRMQRRVIAYCEKRVTWRRTYVSSGGTGNSLWFFNSGPARPSPRPASARNWYRQALDDFKAARNDVPPTAEEVSYVWACHKCHQSAEKALKAAQFAVDANLKSMTHDLNTVACTLDLPAAQHVQVLAGDLQRLLGDPTRLRYPDVYSQGVPSDYFKEHHAQEARRITKNILDVVAVFLETRGVELNG